MLMDNRNAKAIVFDNNIELHNLSQIICVFECLH